MLVTTNPQRTLWEAILPPGYEDLPAPVGPGGRAAFSRTATGRPVSVLSVGCGDGAVDVALADALTARDPGRPVRYVGVDPHPASGAAFRR